MRKVVAFITGLLVFASPTLALASTQVWMGAMNVNSSTNTGVSFTQVGLNASTIATGIMADSGSVTKFTAYVGNSPGAGTWTVSVSKNGSTQSMSCTITGSATSCSTTANPVSYVAGDYIYAFFSGASSPNTTTKYAVAELTPTTANETIVSMGGAVSNTTTKFDQLMGGAANTTENAAQNIFSEAGTLENMFVGITAAQGGSTVETYTLRKNAVSDANVTCSMTTPATTCQQSSLGTGTTTDATSVFGTLASLTSGTGSTATGGIGYVWVPSTAGDFPLLGSSNGAGMSNTVTNYIPCSGLLAFSQVEASTTEYTDAMTATSLSAHLRSTTGGAKSYTVTVDKNSIATSLACTITSGTGCNTTGSVTFDAGDTCDISMAPSNTPAVSTMVQVAMGAQFNASASGPSHDSVFMIKGLDYFLKGNDFSI